MNSPYESSPARPRSTGRWSSPREPARSCCSRTEAAAGVTARATDSSRRLCTKRSSPLLIDLLTLPEEAVDASAAHLRFDIAFLAARLIAATDWLLAAGATRDLRIGYFGASTGAAAALVAAAEHPAAVGAIVSRGGRPDLARDMLGTVSAPTLLIVGGH